VGQTIFDFTFLQQWLLVAAKFLPSIVPNDEECDATGDDSIDVAKYIKSFASLCPLHLGVKLNIKMPCVKKQRTRYDVSLQRLCEA
jgi:hypothetical protein